MRELRNQVYVRIIADISWAFTASELTRLRFVVNGFPLAIQHMDVSVESVMNNPRVIQEDSDDDSITWPRSSDSEL